MKNTYTYWIAPAVIIAVIAFGIVWWIRLDTTAPVVSEGPSSTTTIITTTTPLATTTPTEPISNTNENQVGTYGAPASSINQGDLFIKKPLPPGSPVYGNVVGYFSYGAFVIYVPDWFVDNWKMTEIDVQTGLTITASSTLEINTMSPRDYDGPRSFSDIVMKIVPIDEASNAEYQYQQELLTKAYDQKGVVADRGILVNHDQSGYIYYVQRVNSETEKYTDIYFIDGHKKTARIEFSVTGSADYLKFSPKVKELVDGLGEGKGVQG
ncbi:MAG: hypothetical protein RIT04_312 [Candidatus Parcubacteria bacterium]|jgi:hypothetical protein